jgi:hypothetical protein
VNVDEEDGKRGWLLLRQSLHDPLLVLNVESDVAGGKSVSSRLVCGGVSDRKGLLGMLLSPGEFASCCAACAWLSRCFMVCCCCCYCCSSS